jgi:(S)-ureidoglycine aminohydrolase
VNPFATGGRRKVFNRPTSMFENFAAHVTTLNAGLQNHAIHTHRVEELVVIRRGEVEMQIGEEWHRASAGDVVFLASQVPHALGNVETAPTEYFAIQWRVAE